MAGPQRHCGRRDEVALGVADGRKLGPQPTAVLAAGTLEEVAGGLLALQAGGIHSGLRLVANQAALLGAHGSLEKEQNKLPFFNSRPEA